MSVSEAVTQSTSAGVAPRTSQARIGSKQKASRHARRVHPKRTKKPRHHIEARQDQLRKRVKRRGISTNQPMQSLAELRKLSGLVVAHLLRSVNSATDDHREALAGLGMLSRGKNGRIQDAHRGKSIRIRWNESLCSPGIQELTRYVFFDGDDEGLLDEFDRRSAAMKVQHSTTSQGEPVTTITPDRANEDDIRIESQPDGFGIVWPTSFSASDALKLAMAVLPDPEDDDVALVIIEPGVPREVPAKNLIETLEGTNGDTAAVSVEIGSAALGWAVSVGDGPALAALSFGDDYYAHDQIESLLAKTANFDEFVRDRVLHEADDTLQKHLRP